MTSRAMRGRVLTPSVDLLETLAVRGGCAQHFDLHLERLMRSARELSRPVDARAIRREVLALADALASPTLLRIRVRSDGEALLEPRPLTEMDGPVRLAIDDPVSGGVPIDPADPRVRHKTSDRAHLEAARARHRGADDVVLVNADGHVAETTVANLLVLLDGAWVTPPLSDGLLAGVGRRLAIERDDVLERSLSVADLRRAAAIELVSSARGRRPATLS